MARVEVVTAAQAEDWQRRAAGGLRQAGCRFGDRVAFCLPSSAALLCTVLGALRAGVVPVLLNATLLGPRSVLVDDARPRLVITEAAQLEALGAGRPVDLAEHPLSRPMHYTSGTTGSPKECGPACGTSRRLRLPSTTKPISGPSGPMTSTWSARPCTTRCRSASLAARCCEAEHAWSSTASSPIPPSMHCEAAWEWYRPRRSWLRPRSSACSRRWTAKPQPSLLPPPAGPCRLPVPCGAEARRLGCCRPRHAVGVLRVDRGPVHRVRPRRMDGPPRNGGPGPGRAHLGHHPDAPSGAGRRTSVPSGIGTTTPRPGRRGVTAPSPSAISAASMPTGTSSSKAAETTSSSLAG